MKPGKNRMNRRQFIRGAAGAALCAPVIVPASARGADGYVAPSNRIVMGCIGVGGRGTTDMRNFLQNPEIQVVAVADPDRAHRNRARGLVDEKYAEDRRGGKYQGCLAVKDFREFIDRPDLDALSIATPDHWHSIPVIMGARAGKDIYAEKPLARTIDEGRKMVDAVERYGVVYQVGSQQRSSDNFRYGCELVRNGRLGDLHAVEVGLPQGPSCGPEPEAPTPEGFDYDFWLGPAPYTPYTKKSTHWDFRWIHDYSGGQITDWSGHHIDIAQWGMGTEDTGPIEIHGRGIAPKDGLWNTITDYTFHCRYKNGVQMIVSSDKKRVRSGTKFIGSEGWLWVDRGRIEAEPASLLTSVIGPDEIHLHRSPGHYKDFINSVYSREPTVAPIWAGHRSIAVGHLGLIAMELGRKLRWNPDIERFIDDPGADRKLTRSMRDPWRA